MKIKILLGFALFASVILLAKLVNFRGGVILGEPDEMVHAEVVKSLINTKTPSYNGTGFYYDLPAYFTVSALFSYFLFHDPLVSLRFVSLIATLATAVIIYYYLLKKDGRRAAVIGSLTYFLIPLSTFYLRVGVIEPFLVFCLTGAFCFFDLGRGQKNILLSLLSGLFLGVGLLTKYSILPILTVMIVYLAVDFIWSNRVFYKETYLRVNLYSFVPVALGLAIFLPLLYFFYKHDPATVKWQTYQVLGWYGGVKQELRLERFFDFSWWYSLPVLILSIVGLLRIGVNFKKYLFLILCGAVMFLVVLSRLPFYPRYALTLVPFLAIFLSLGLSLIKSNKLVAALVFGLFVINVLPLVTAYKSSFQRLIEDSVSAVGRQPIRPVWTFSNYWPNYFGNEVGVSKFAWLTYDGPDLRAFAPGEERDALTILKNDGGVVFLENLYADLTLTQQPGRMRAIDEVRKVYKPNFTVKSTRPNFPFSKKVGNSVDVYVFNTL